MKKLLIGCIVSLTMFSSVYASQWTIIRTSGNPVQCNNWGWVHGNSQTVWSNPCTPLEVQKWNGEILSVPTTENQCNDGDAAVYYSNGKTIDFWYCTPVSK